jgi:hypothetical protein
MLPEVLPYHLRVRDHFKRLTSIWEFFAAARTHGDQQAEIPQTHFVFRDPIRRRLDKAELLAVVAHELARIHLHTILDGDLEVADRIVTAIADHPDSEVAYYETARIFKLYTEIYCDRVAFTVAGDSGPVISGLQIPEDSIRSRAVRLWQDQREAAEPVITKMIEGLAGLDRLDLFTREALYALTRDILLELLEPEWTRTAVVMGLAHQYFPGLSWQEEAGTGVRERLISALAGAEPSIHEYFSYLLLDFALADPSLENLLPERALAFAGELGLSAVFDPIFKKEGIQSK